MLFRSIVSIVFVFMLFLGAQSILAVSSSVQTTPLQFKGQCNGCSFSGSDPSICKMFSFCEFKQNICQPVASCSAINNITGCTSARLYLTGMNCRWNYGLKKCIDISSTACTSIPGNSKLNCSNSGCGYITGNYCSYPPKVTSCSSITDGSCGLFQAEGQSCSLNSKGGCELNIGDCNIQTVVPFSNRTSMIPQVKKFTCSRCGMYGGNQSLCKQNGQCQFLNGNCTPVTSCSRINDTESCNTARIYGVGLNCLWKSNLNKCVSLSNSQCGSIPGNSNYRCSQYGCGYTSGNYCSNPVNITSCGSIQNMGCFLFQAQNQLCQPVNGTSCQSFQMNCSTQMVGQVTKVTSIVPKVQSQTCNYCSSQKNQSVCLSLGFCQWINSKCTPVTSCSQINSQGPCSAARLAQTGLNCYWNSLITNKCMSLSSVPCNQIFSKDIQSCAMYGCGYDQGYFCTNPPSQAISSCSSIKNGACALYQTSGALCIPSSSGSCYTQTFSC